MSFLSSETKSSILITGGSSGIGLAMAQSFLSMGHEVIAVDKDQSKLDDAKANNPKLLTICMDIANDQGRKSLKDRLLSEFPQVNVLINNAAVNPCPPPLKDTTETDWSMHKEEFQVNLMAPLHLTILLLPHFQQKAQAMIMNVTSIFAFFPLANHPTYSATKATLHSFTVSLRHQLRDTSIRVVELVPPLVESPLNCPEFRGKGVQIDEFVKSSLDKLLQDVVEIGYKSDNILRGSRDDLDQMFEEWNGAISSSSGSRSGQNQKGEQKQSSKMEFGQKQTGFQQME